MAVQWSVECKRGGDVHTFLPQDLVVKPELNGRHDPLPEEKFEELIASIASNGQLEPVLVRREAERPVIVAGFNRTMAISEINRRGLLPEPMRVECKYIKCNERDGLFLNYEENNRRNATTAMDDAHLFGQLVTLWQMTEKEIAEKLKLKASFVKSRLALNEVEPEVQKGVANGTIPATTAAQRIKELTAAQQRELVKQKKGKKITAKDVDAFSGKVSKPNLKAVREYIEQFDGPSVSDETREVVKQILAFMDGEA